MNATFVCRLLLSLFSAAAILALATPAQAQLAGGCSCPAGFSPLNATTCILPRTTVTAPAICPYNNIGHIVAAEQQRSFWGINMMFQQERDQLQQSTDANLSSTRIADYATSPLHSIPTTSGYSTLSQKDNPLASGLYDAASTKEIASNPAWGAWMEGLGDIEHDSQLTPGDITHSTNTYTAQVGLDRTQRGILTAADAWVVGLVGSWTKTHTGYEGTPTTMELSGPGIGVYSEYVRGGFSVDLTAKFDFLHMVQSFGGTAPNTEIGITNSGVSGNLQYKFTGFFGSGNSFFEPTAGFSLTHTGFASGAAALGLEDAYTVRLQVGGRAGTSWDASQGVTIGSSLKALVYGDAVAQGTSINPVTSFSSTISPSDTGMVRGEIDTELCFNFPHNYSLTVSGQFRFGQALAGGSAGVSLRKEF
jgi:hypothetical protein